MDQWLGLTDSCGNNESTKKTVDKPKRKRKYDDSFLQYGFTCSCEDGVEKPLCLICNETLSAESLKPSKLKRHLNTKHAESSDKPIQYFERLLKSSKKQKQFTENFFTVNERYMHASYEASYLIAKSTKPFSVGENLVLPAAVKMSEIVHGKKYGDEIRKIPLSNDTVARRIAEISDDQLQQLITRLKKSQKFAIQLDETTDVTKNAQLLVYVRYVHEENVEEELLFCRSLKSHTKGEDIFFKVDEFFTTAGLQWENCIGVCTDGAGAMMGKRAGFVAKVKEHATPERVTFTHCMIHREALTAKHMSLDLDTVLRDAVKIINYIKNNALNSRLFTNICKEQDSNYTSLLMHAEIRWLSRGYSIQRLLQLKDELVMFLTEQKSAFAELFLNDAWVLKLCYLSDIFGKLNDLNMSLQGKKCNIFTFNDRIEAFIKKLTIWKSRTEDGNLEMFAATDDYLTEKHLSNLLIVKVIVDHLNSLHTHFRKYFPTDIDSGKESWIREPFVSQLSDVTHLSLKAQEEFADLSSDKGLELLFSKQTLCDFWIRTRNEYPTLAELALDKLLPFCTTYLCEAAISKLTTIKSKTRASLETVEDALRPALSCIIPRMDHLCKKHQAHPSH